MPCVLQLRSLVVMHVKACTILQTLVPSTMDPIQWERLCLILGTPVVYVQRIELCCCSYKPAKELKHI